MKSFKESKIFMWLWPWKDAYEIICLWKLFCSFYQDTDIVSCQIFQNLILVWIPIEVFVGENCLLLLALLVQLWTINSRVELERRFAWDSVRTCLMLILIRLTSAQGNVELSAGGRQPFWVWNSTGRHMVTHDAEHLAYLGKEDFKDKDKSSPSACWQRNPAWPRNRQVLRWSRSDEVGGGSRVGCRSQRGGSCCSWTGPGQLAVCGFLTQEDFGSTLSSWALKLGPIGLESSNCCELSLSPLKEESPHKMLFTTTSSIYVTE